MLDYSADETWWIQKGRTVYPLKMCLDRFYRDGLNAGQSSQEKAVRPSVCQTRALWQNGRKICPDFYTIWKII